MKRFTRIVFDGVEYAPVHADEPNICKACGLLKQCERHERMMYICDSIIEHNMIWKAHGKKDGQDKPF